MALRGGAFLALWNDVDPARVAEYDDWHTREHVPERVGVAGFLSGRRYVAAERDVGRYFTLYELEALSALDGPAYRDVVDRPTPWSASMRPSLHHFQRHPCATVYSAGAGVSGSIATCRFDLDASRGPFDAVSARAALAGVLACDGIASVHLGCATHDAAFPLRNDANAAGPADAARTPYVLLVEGIARGALDRTAPRIASALQGLGAAASPAATFDLAYAIRRDELPYPTAQRQPPRPPPPA